VKLPFDDDGVDLRADFHGHVKTFADDDDRRWFDEHPGRLSYERRAHLHEFCDPDSLTTGRCRPLFALGPRQKLLVTVVRISAAVTLREPRVVGR
jgi:hypothetical protein